MTTTSKKSTTKKFKEGQKVVLLDHGVYDREAKSNPEWGYKERYIFGVVDEVMREDGSDYKLYIDWDNGTKNSYYLSDCEIELFSKVAKKQKKAGEKLNMAEFGKLILDQESKDEISSVLKQHENQDKIFKEWGLDEVIEYGKGMTFLFYGSPGTGKTWAANCISGALETDLLVVSAAEIQTSEPGGANRNIQNAFLAASTEGKILFFDECDSLITQRNDVGMIIGSEINTLLTEIDKFEGVVILATNRIGTLDEALERRISLIIEFPEPDFQERQQIWSKLLPKKMPLGKTVDLEKLAEYKLTGGQIKNAILQAARFVAANNAKQVDLKYFDMAISRITKSKSLMGKSSRYRQTKVKEDFGGLSGGEHVESDKKPVKVKEMTKKPVKKPAIIK